MFKNFGSNLKVQYSKCVMTCERIRLTFGLFFFPLFFHGFFYFLFLLHIMDDQRHKIEVVFVFIIAMH